MSQITADRDGDAIPRGSVKKAIQIYVDIGLLKPKPIRTSDGLFLWQGDRSLSEYDSLFEESFLQATLQKSTQNAQIWNTSRNCPEYLGEVQRFLANEEANADYWL